MNLKKILPPTTAFPILLPMHSSAMPRGMGAPVVLEDFAYIAC